MTTPYKYCVINDVLGSIQVCGTQTEAEELCASKRKHVLNSVRGLPRTNALVQAAERRAHAYVLGTINLLTQPV